MGDAYRASPRGDELAHDVVSGPAFEQLQDEVDRERRRADRAEHRLEVLYRELTRDAHHRWRHDSPWRLRAAIGHRAWHALQGGHRDYERGPR